MNTISFLWHKGVDPLWLIETLRDKLTTPERVIKSRNYFNGYYTLQYEIDGKVADFEAVTLPQPDDTIGKRDGFRFDGCKCWKIRWNLGPPDLTRKTERERGQKPWAMCVIARDRETDAPGHGCFLGDKVIRLRMFVDEDLTPWRFIFTPHHLAGAVEKYHLAKRLYEELGCDVVEGTSDRFNYRGEQEPDPDLESRLFRFARTGTNILYRPMEERRMITEEELQGHTWRVEADPH